MSFFARSSEVSIGDKSELSATLLSGADTYCNGSVLEVCIDEETDEWADWVDEDGFDDIDQWLREHEPEHYAHLKEQFDYYREFENE